MSLYTPLCNRILLLSIGTYGDVFPFLTIGQRLVERGHQVTMVTNGYFADHVRAAGMEIVEAGTAEDYRAYVNNPNLWHPYRGLQLTRRVFSVSMRPIFEYIRDEWQTNDSLLVSSVHCMSARVAQESLGVPLITLNMAPIVLGNRIDLPVVHPSIRPDRLPKFLRPTYGWLVDWITDRLFGGALNAYRRELGLPPVKRLMRWWHSPMMSLSLFPEWFGARDQDLPTSHTFVGFPFVPKSPTQIEDRIEKLLSQSPKPILIFTGSGVSRVRNYFDICAEICKRVNRPGIFVAPNGSDLDGTLPSHMAWTSFVPIAEVLPRVAMVIHHGGIGIVAESLRSGVPQLVRPLAFDQPDNAARIEKLGVGRWIAPNQFKPQRVVASIEQLIENPIVIDRCREYQRRLSQERSLEAVCEAVESTLQLST